MNVSSTNVMQNPNNQITAYKLCLHKTVLAVMLNLNTAVEWEISEKKNINNVTKAGILRNHPCENYKEKLSSFTKLQTNLFIQAKIGIAKTYSEGNERIAQALRTAEGIKDLMQSEILERMVYDVVEKIKSNK